MGEGERKATREVFERLKGQVGACGIWCGSCAVGTGTLQESAQRLVGLVEGHGVDDWGPKEVPPAQYLAGLRAIAAIPLCPGCSRGGGRDGCEMRGCASTKGIGGCNGCAEGDRCPHAGILHHMREGAVRAGLFIEEVEGGREARIAAWTAQLKRRYPSALTFLEDPDAP